VGDFNEIEEENFRQGAAQRRVDFVTGAHMLKMTVLA
jgi:hypothetical protein